MSPRDITVFIWETGHKHIGDNQTKHAITQEFLPFIRIYMPTITSDEARMCQRVAQKIRMVKDVANFRH